MTLDQVLAEIDAIIKVRMREREDQEPDSKAEWAAIGSLDGLATARAIVARAANLTA